MLSDCSNDKNEWWPAGSTSISAHPLNACSERKHVFVRFRTNWILRKKDKFLIKNILDNRKKAPYRITIGVDNRPALKTKIVGKLISKIINEEGENLTRTKRTLTYHQDPEKWRVYVSPYQVMGSWMINVLVIPHCSKENHSWCR